MKFEIYFFKIKGNSVFQDELINHFSNICDYEVENHINSDVLIEINDEILSQKCELLFTKKGMVDRIYKIDSQYKNLNFKLSIDITAPNLFVKKIFKKIEKLVLMFDLYTYIKLFQKIIKYESNDIFEEFIKIKETIFEKKPEIFKDKFFLTSNEFKFVYDYEKNLNRIKKGFINTDVEIPNYLFLHKDNEKKIYLSIDYKEKKSCIIPFGLNFVHYVTPFNVSIIEYSNFFEIYEKNILDVKLFKARILDVKKIKNFKKILKNINVIHSQNDFNYVKLKDIIEVI